MRLGKVLFRNLAIFAGILAAVGGCVGLDRACPQTELRPSSQAPRARNVIVMIADGCGYNHVAAASIYRHGEAGRTVCDGFPVKVAVSTYPAGGSYDPQAAWKDFDYVKRGATDSAAAATALATGEKTYNGAIGVTGSAENPVRVETVLERAEGLGKATGVVTSVQFSHATPAAFVAHNKDRDNYAEIANEMIFESAADVIMGCGHPYRDKDGKVLEEPDDFQFIGGEDTWKAILAGPLGADADGDGEGDPWTVIQTREEFVALAEGEAPDRVLGIPPCQTALQQRRGVEKNADPYVVPLCETSPTLAEMTRAALNVLDDDPDGLFLMVEGGAVDWAAHSNQTGRMIEEELDFLDAVAAVVAWVEKESNWDETLLIVTGDHETGYVTGPESGSQGEGGPAVWNPLVSNGAGKAPGLQWNSGSHTNSLLPLFAKGRAAAVVESLADGHDEVRGAYIDNVEVARAVLAVMGPAKKPAPPEGE